jgi:prepilin-type N-terminal cleavage/methylation domain-containing protein
MNRFRRKPGQKGFTMIELMVVVIIVGILAAIAIPLYGKYIKNARLSEGTGRIGEIVTAAKAWAQEHQSVAGVPQWPTVDDGIFDISSGTENFTYSLPGGGGGDATGPFVIQATGINKMAGVTITQTIPDINSAGAPPVVAGF